MLIEKKNFLKGLNSDLAARLLGDGEILNLMNGRVGVTEYGRYGRIENILGSTLITQAVVPPYGQNICIGSTTDNARSRIIYFLCNTNNDHGIYCYDILSGNVYAVLYDSQVIDGLNFSKTSRIDRNAKVVGDILYWTDNLNEPRRINIEAGIKMNHASYVTTVSPYQWPMNQSVISLIRRPYGLPVTPTKVNAGGVSENFITEFAGQFASRLVYRDGEYSVVSVPSAMVNYNVYGATENDIQVTFPLIEDFDQDVQAIELLVRYGNDPDYFVIKTWNKANATDLAEINAHNAGSTNLTYNFYNNETGNAIGLFDSIKPFDDIGLLVKSLEYANQRLFLANYTKGYNTPSVTSLDASISTNPADPSLATALKCNSGYQIAIQFRDKAKRKSFIVTNANCIVNSPDRSYSTVPYSNLAWSVSNAAATTEIPDWAYYYDIMVTKNQRTRNFIQHLSSNLQYAKKQADGTYTYQNTYDNSIYAVAVDISILTGTGSGYAYAPNDLCRLYLSNTATVYELTVLTQDGNYVLVKPQDLGSLNPMPGCYFEIYTPYKPSDNETFYTTGQSYLISNPGTGSRSYSTTSGIIDGDITRYKATINIVFLSLTIRGETMSPNYNKWKDWLQFYGESNISSLLGQVQKENFINWSNPKILGAQILGLSTFNSLDEKGLPDELGAINKIQLANKVADQGQGNVMLAICNTETASLYLGEVQMTAAALAGQVGLSTSVIGTVNVLTGSYGTQNPESVVEYLGLVFWLDVMNGCFVQYSSGGLEPVSRYKMSRFFKNYCKDYSEASSGNLDNINGFHHIPTCVDPFHKEILCTLPGLIYSNYADTLPSYSSVPTYASSIIDRFDIYDQLAKTMAYCYEENKWGSNYEWMPEWMEYIDNQLYGFKNGALYLMNSNTTNWNTVFGTEYPLRACFTCNINSSLLKSLFNIALEGSQHKPNFTVAMATNPNTQITDLAFIDGSDMDDWTNNEGILYAAFFRDRLSPNASGTADQKLYSGDVLLDTAIFVMLEFQVYDELIFINFANIGFESSKGQSNITNVVNT